MVGTRLPWEVLRHAAVGAADVFLAAPYIKADALNRVLELISPSATVTCVSRWRVSELATGVSDAKCRTLTTDRGGEFKLHPSLHGKYYRLDDIVLVGSANLTRAGLGYDVVRNLEILCNPGTEFKWREFEDRLVADSRVVSDKEFQWWSSIEVVFGAKASGQSDPPVAEPDLIGWRPQTREPDHLWRAYQGNQHLIPGVDEAEMAQQDLRHLALRSGMDRDRFDKWVACSLLGSTFVSQVWNFWNEDRGITRSVLAEKWGLTRSDVERDIQTAEIWLARFLGIE